MNVNFELPVYALVQLTEDPDATHLYVPLNSFRRHDKHAIRHSFHQFRQRTWRCTYSPFHDSAIADATFHSLPISKRFDPQRHQSVYEVRIVDLFNWHDTLHGLPDEPLRMTGLRLAGQHIEVFLRHIQTAEQDPCAARQTNALRRVHELLLQQDVSDMCCMRQPALAETMVTVLLDELRDTQEVATRVAGLMYLQMHDSRARVSFADRIVPLLSQIVINRFDTPHSMTATPVRTRCCPIFATMAWLHGRPMQRVLCGIGRILVGSLGKQRGEMAGEWSQFQAALLDAFALLVTYLPASHLCILWANSSPVVPSVEQLTALMQGVNSLEVRIRVAKLMAIIVEHCRSDENRFMEDRMPQIAESIVSGLNETRFVKRDRLSETDKAVMEAILASVENDLAAKSQTYETDIKLKTWAGQHRYSMLKPILGDNLQRFLTMNPYLKEALTRTPN